MRVGVIGAGAAGAAATYVVDGGRPDARITVLEGSDSVGGRAATRRDDGRIYDYGANYLKDGDDRVVDLVTDALDADGLVRFDGSIHVFDGGGRVSEGRPTDERQWTYREGLAEIATRLLDPTDAAVERDTPVERIAREGDRWLLSDADGGEWGPFDRLLCTPPAPQTARLLGDAEWDSPVRESLAGAADDVAYRTTWSGVLGYEFELDRPYYALVNPEKTHAVGWISREACKPGHVPDGESVLVVQANEAWSVERLDADPAESLAELAEMAADVVGDERLADPAWTDHHGWRHAQPETGLDREALAPAASAGLHCAGDWVAGEGRLHAAIRSGLDAGDRIVRSG